MTHRSETIRLDVHIHTMSDVLPSLAKIEALLNSILSKENEQMALGEDILARITAESTVIDSIKTLIQGLVASGTIPAAVAAAINAKLDENDAALTAAILAGTPPPPPTP